MKKVIYIAIVILAILGAIYILSAKKSPYPSFDDMIQVTNVKEGDVITSPFTIQGQARGPWFFEASFPAVLVDWDGRIIAQVPAEARPSTEGGWMTNDYVPFDATFVFEKPAGDIQRGAIILKKDNPSGDPAKDASLEIPINFE